MTVTGWSYFVQATDGQGSVFEPLPAADSGTITQTFADPDLLLSITATVFRSAGPNYQEIASETLTQPSNGWPRC
jgi:hypothetical protein